MNLLNRFPAKPHILKVFLTALAVVNSWGLIVFFYTFPGLIKNIYLGELFAVLAYLLAGAFFESLVVTALLLLLAFLLPASWLRADFANRGAMLLLLTTIYIIPYHSSIPRISFLVIEVAVSLFIAMWTTLYLVEIVLFHLILQRYPKFIFRLEAVIERITVLGAIYLFLDVVSAGYVLLAFLR